jgi:GNAT superfamily N-acetyltransferase
LRWAEPGDVDALLELYTLFFLESGYTGAIELDLEKAREYLTRAMAAGHCYIIAKVGDEIAGMMCFEIDDNYTKKPIAVMGEIYAREKYRGTGLGRALVISAFTAAQAAGATCMHIPITSQHKNVPTLVNLFKKYGAEEIGVIMRKVF